MFNELLIFICVQTLFMNYFIIENLTQYHRVLVSCIYFFFLLHSLLCGKSGEVAGGCIPKNYILEWSGGPRQCTKNFSIILNLFHPFKSESGAVYFSLFPVIRNNQDITGQMFNIGTQYY